MKISLNFSRANRHDGWRLVHPLVHALPLVTAAVALWAPIDVLQRVAWLESFCRYVMQIFPFLKAHVAISGYPQVTILVLCLSWTFIAPSIGLVWYVLWPYRHRALQRIQSGELKVPQKKAIPLAMIGFFLLIYAFWLVPGDPSFCQGCTASNRITFALLMYAATVTLAFLPWLIAIVFFIHYSLNRTSNTEK